jgi:hypothetical protein
MHAPRPDVFGGAFARMFGGNVALVIPILALNLPSNLPSRVSFRRAITRDAALDQRVPHVWRHGAHERGALQAGVRFKWINESRRHQ